jgi:nucleotide-binding universal stress UspA family protein
MLGHILVAVDGSEGSKRAAKFAHDVAVKTGARLTLLYVLDIPTMIPLAPFDSVGIVGQPPGPEELKAADSLLKEIARDLPTAQTETRVEIGNPAHVITEQAEKLGCDHVVVGARGLGAPGRWLLGSTSDRVVHHSKVPVTVVHAERSSR